jgi:hypothetical protein
MSPDPADSPGAGSCLAARRLRWSTPFAGLVRHLACRLAVPMASHLAQRTSPASRSPGLAACSHSWAVPALPVPLREGPIRSLPSPQPRRHHWSLQFERIAALAHRRGGVAAACGRYLCRWLVLISPNGRMGNLSVTASPGPSASPVIPMPLNPRHHTTKWIISALPKKSVVGDEFRPSSQNHPR